MAPPIYVKGGVWTNVEDQILKAAVSKYGLTQWARVASLLPKKTAKQAKARWNEYLNPSIDRSEWTKQDDEKLLNLAKLMPNQWRSIAPVVGRTATQCVERYQKLLDDAVNGSDSDDGSDKEDVSLSGPGIETLPALGNAFESLPSRPDVEDMDDDEREMLSEAKARLANNLGKKAKRKERERMLDESRRVALLQKRRELKAAGINISLTSKNKARRKEFDYVADIPHERQPLPGLYDVTKEDNENEMERSEFQKKVTFKGVPDDDNKSKADRDKAAKAESKRSRAAIQSAAGAVSTLDSQVKKRRKLELSTPGSDAQDSLVQSVSELARGFLNKTPSVAKPEVSSTEKFSKKALVSFLQSHLAKLPQPKIASTVVVPSVEEADLVDAPLTSDGTTPQKTTPENREWMRTQVAQKGYAVPHPSELPPLGQGASGLERSIHEEAKALMESDAGAGSELGTTPLEEEAYHTVMAEIYVELENQKNAENPGTEGPHYHPLSELQPLPRDASVVEKVYDVLESLDQSSNRADETSAGFLREQNEDLLSTLADNFARLQDVDIEEKMYGRIAQEEDLALAARSAKLHEMVEDIKAAENRASRHT